MRLLWNYCFISEICYNLYEKDKHQGEAYLLFLLLGVYWIVLAILNWFGCSRVIRKKYRNEPWCRLYQKDIAVSDIFIGVGSFIWGIKYPQFFQLTVIWPWFILGLIYVVALVMAVKVRHKYNI